MCDWSVFKWYVAQPEKYKIFNMFNIVFKYHNSAH